MSDLRETASWGNGYGLPDESNETPPSSLTSGFSIFSTAYIDTSTLSAKGRSCTGANIPSADTSRHHPNPSAGYTRPAKLALPSTSEIVTHLSPQPPPEKKFSLADALHAPEISYISPLFDMAATQSVQDENLLPSLTAHNLDQLLFWHREHVKGKTPHRETPGSVWIKQESDIGTKWIDSGKNWKFIEDALIKGTHGIEETFPNLRSYIQSRKPELTPDSVLALLKSTSEKMGHKILSLSNPVWIKDQNPDGEILWRPSLYTFTEIDLFIRKNQDVFKAIGLTEFKRGHGYPSGREAGLLTIAPATAILTEPAKVCIPLKTLSEPVSHQDLNQLAAWFREREGEEPTDDTTKPVWIKLESGGWAKAVQSWAILIAPLKAELANLTRELEATQTRLRAFEPALSP